MYKIRLTEVPMDPAYVESEEGRLVDLSLPEALRYQRVLAEFREANRMVKDRYDSADPGGEA